MGPKLIFSKLHIVTFSVLLCLSINAQAQKQMYRTVMPDGSVVYTDTPPAGAKQTTVVDKLGGGVNTGGDSQVNMALLPNEVRMPYANYPVTLYSTHNCDSCNTGRSALNNRGIPFIEYTVVTPKDFAVIKERFGSEQPSFPLLTVGSKVLTGYDSGQWNNYLDVAGFPKTSKLPSSYNNPAARPLTQPTPEDLAPKEDKAPTKPSPSLPPASDRTNEGIQRPDIRF